MNHLENIKALDDLIKRYHGREGTFNFHYHGFTLEGWDPSLRYSLSKEEYDRMETEDYAVMIIYTDNSMSNDTYWVLLQDVIAWGEANGC